MSNQVELAAMRRAVELAARGLGATNPNPVVGAVVLDAAGEIVGEGFHPVAGGPHAEVVALRAAGDRARGATCVVTLEPCAHTGRTGPCTQALIEAGVARVVLAVRDPNPAAAGGAAVLTAAGIEVETGLLEAEAERVNEAWLTSIRLGRPFVTWKYAASLDGRTAAADGTSRWITSSEARADVHRLRAEADAVLVGSGTLLADDPHLAVRKAPLLRAAPPLRVVLDSNARTPAHARVLDDAAPTVILVAEDAASGEGARALRKAGAELVAIPRAAEGLDLTRALGFLHQRGVVSVLVEGGARLAGGFVAERLVDKVVAYIAPALIGGGGMAALSGPGAATIDAALRLRLDEIAPIGVDVRLTARPVRWRSEQEV